MLFKSIKGVHLDGKKEMSIKNEIVPFLNPKFVYFPTVSGTVVYKSLVSVGDKVLKGQPILQRNDRFGHPVCSSVSGEVSAIKKMWHPIGRMVEMIEIKNDFEETAVEAIGQGLVELTKEKIVERVMKAGIVGHGGAGMPTYVKYQPVANQELLIVDAAECEPYITSDHMLIKTDVEELIRGIKYVLTAIGAKEAKICVKKTKKELIDVLEAACKEEGNISVFLVNDVYPAGWERYLVEKVTKQTYKALPTEIGVIVNNVQTVISVCQAVEQNMPLIEKVVTFSGEGLKNPCNVKVKIGTKASDVIDAIGGYVDGLGESYFIAGGPMTGKSIMFDEVVITANLNSVVIKVKAEAPAFPCIGCGKCAEACPVFLTPTEIKGAHEAGDNDALNALNASACIQCGLCSYVCPSRVEITEAVGKAKEAVLKANALKNARK